MFNVLASKLGEVQAFADGLGNPLEALSMDRLRDEEERKESSSSRQRESCRSPRARGDEPGGGVMDGLTLDDELQQGVDDGKIDGNTPHRGTATSLHYRRPAVSPRCARDNSDVSGCGGGHSAPGELELPHRHSQAEHEILMNGFGIMNKFGKIDDKDLECMGDDDDGNFEDEFDPILASIRKPPQPSPTASCASSSTVGGGSKNSSSPGKGGISEGGDRGKRHDSGVSFGTGLRSIFPRNVRARAEDVVTQSSANMSKTAGAFRVAFGLGVNGTGGTGWRRDSSTGMVREEGREKDLGTISSARRVGLGGGKCSGLGGEEDVLVLDANELLSEEERRQLATISGGGGGRFCGWRRLRKYAPIVAGVALFSAIYLWRWKALPEDVAGVAGEAGEEAAALGPGRI